MQTLSAPMDPLIVLNGKLNGVGVRVLKDDGCKASVVSRSFFEKHMKHFGFINENIKIRHSKRSTDVFASNV